MIGVGNGNGRVAAPRAELPCRELVGLSTAYLEGALPVGERRRFEAHLRACPGCETYLAQMRQMIGALGALRGEDVPPDRRERMLAAFRGWQSR